MSIDIAQSHFPSVAVYEIFEVKMFMTLTLNFRMVQGQGKRYKSNVNMSIPFDGNSNTSDLPATVQGIFAKLKNVKYGVKNLHQTDGEEN